MYTARSFRLGEIAISPAGSHHAIRCPSGMTMKYPCDQDRLFALAHVPLRWANACIEKTIPAQAICRALSSACSGSHRQATLREVLAPKVVNEIIEKFLVDLNLFSHFTITVPF